MATFHIQHQDEKENNTLLLNDKYNLRNVENNGKDTNKRSTFAVLSNVPNNIRTQQGKPGFRDLKENTDGGGNKIYGRTQQQKKTIISANTHVIPNNKSAVPSVPVEQFKFFTVYEDENNIKGNNETKEILTHLDESITYQNTSISSTIREPLKDITLRDELLETPMSVGDVLTSPMSIDKSSIGQIDESILSSANKKSPKKQTRNDRERFFDVKEYQQDILEYFREIEKKHRPKPTYMQRQPDINYSMRTILVDWLVEVSEEYRLHTETLFLAISYIDRFLSYMSVVRAKLQLVGTAAMFIASKYEEIYPPDLGEFVFITDDTYTKNQVLRMEQIMLKILSFDLCAPTSYVFINTYAVLYNMPDQVKFLAMYISELALLEGDPFLQYLPSQISSAAVAIARYILDIPIWDRELEFITSYKLEDLKSVMLHLCRTHNLAATLSQQAIQEKYKQSKFMEVSTIKPVQLNLENINTILSEQQKIIDELEINKSEEGNMIQETTIRRYHHCTKQ